MNRENLYLSTVDPNAHLLSKRFGLGLEIAEFCTAWNLDRDLTETEEALKPKLSCTDRFTLHGPFNELFPCAIDPKAQDLAAFRFRQAMAQAQKYGISRVIFHGGYNPWLYFPCWYQEQSPKFWQELLPYIPENMVLYVENVLEEEPEMLAGIIRAVDSPKIRMCLDIGHANAYSKHSPFDWIDQCADVIGHFHIHNNDGTWDTHRPLFDGTISMEELLFSIDAKCPAATITLELPEAESSVLWLTDHHFLEG